MKKNLIKHYALAAAIMLITGSCSKDLEPYNGKSDKLALETPEDLQTATYGVYSCLVDRLYTKNLNQLGEYPGDDVALSGATGDQVFYTYTYTHFPGMGNTEQFWQGAYKVIYSANAIIAKITDGTSPLLDQLKGENLYLRAMAHFDLVRIFGKPYSQGAGNNPGIVIKDNTKDDRPARSTVKHVYEFIIADLKKAATMMTDRKNAAFASKEVAEALLSRVYLYMEDNNNVLLYADKVISSNRYKLVETQPYKTYFRVVPEENSETIFAIRHTVADDRGKDAIGSMYYNEPVTQATGWGEVYASLAFVKLLDQHPEDVRHSFIEPQRDANGNMQLRNQTPVYFINKYNWQEGIANLSSPVILRLAEMYLNRAEANAKLGNKQAAIDDVNIIRRRAGLSGTALYTVNDLKGHASVLEVVLEERRLELAFEAHRPYDLFRNNLPMIRAYPGFHGTNQFDQTILPTNTQVINFIPERETGLNPNLTQNP
jgi:hypothetical protein